MYVLRDIEGIYDHKIETVLKQYLQYLFLYRDYML